MALTINCDSVTETISLEEYLARTRAAVNPRDVDTIVANAPSLRALVNNKTFLVDEINQRLAAGSFQDGNRYTAQTLLLGEGPGWFVRVNMWVPPSAEPQLRDTEEKLFSYLLAHDHNFSFLTAGCWGPGYATTIYEYDPESVVGIPGEHVDIRFLERTTLPVGKVMMYRASRDIHVQEHPLSFSVSVNLMLVTPEVRKANQYIFDLERSTIDRLEQNGLTARALVCKLAGQFANGRTVDLLDGLSIRHDSPLVRKTAYESLAQRAEGDAARVWERALTDRHELVRARARQALEGRTHVGD